MRLTACSQISASLPSLESALTSELGTVATFSNVQDRSGPQLDQPSLSIFPGAYVCEFTHLNAFNG